MFEIENGRANFWQWDVKQRLIVEDASIEQVHFCNRTDDCSLKREVYNENGKRIVNVPDILLQDDWRIHVYAWDNNYTKYEEVFEVEKRTKPPTYVYTEEEITEYAALEARIDEVEQNGISDARLEESIAAYIAENPIEGGASPEQAAQIAANTSSIAAIQKDYATKEYVDDAIADINVSGGSADLSNYYTKAQTDNRIAAAVENVPQPDLSDYYTKSEVDSAIAANGGGSAADVDLSNYYTKDEVDALIPDVSAYQTAAQVQALIDTSLGVIENGTY